MSNGAAGLGMIHNATREPGHRPDPMQTALPEQALAARTIEQWQRRFLRQIALLESEARHLPSASRQAALTRLAALRTSFLASAPGGIRP
jgi:hypothetical protein